MPANDVAALHFNREMERHGGSTYRLLPQAPKLSVRSSRARRCDNGGGGVGIRPHVLEFRSINTDRMAVYYQTHTVQGISQFRAPIIE